MPGGNGSPCPQDPGQGKRRAGLRTAARWRYAAWLIIIACM